MPLFRHIGFILLLLFEWSASKAYADSLLIAVASNFSVTAQEIAEQFSAVAGHDVRISAASTGHLFVQIENGAPYDILLAADVRRPQLLESSGLGVEGSRHTYAIGRLVLWSRDPEIRGQDCLRLLDDLGSARLAIANPEFAPYGTAARQMLQQLELWDRVQSRLVIGENIAQTLQFVASGNARFGLIAMSQIDDVRLPAAACSWHVPPDLHQPIEQQAIILERATNNTAASDFLKFLTGDAGRAIIVRHGYLVPGRDG